MAAAKLLSKLESMTLRKQKICPWLQSTCLLTYLTGIIKATKRNNPRLGFYCAKYTNPKYCMYK